MTEALTITDIIQCMGKIDPQPRHPNFAALYTLKYFLLVGAHKLPFKGCISDIMTNEAWAFLLNAPWLMPTNLGTAPQFGATLSFAKMLHLDRHKNQWTTFQNFNHAVLDIIDDFIDKTNHQPSGVGVDSSFGTMAPHQALLWLQHAYGNALEEEMMANAQCLFTSMNKDLLVFSFVLPTCQ